MIMIEMDCILKHLASIFSYSSGRGPKKIPLILLRKKLIDALVLHFKAIFSARVKVSKKDFSIVLAAKQQSAITELH